MVTSPDAQYDPRDRNHDGRVDLGEALHYYVRHPWLDDRLKAGPVKVADQLPRGGGWGARLARRNAGIAVVITKAVGSMWCAYVFIALTLVSLPAAIATGDSIVIVSWIAQTFFQLVLLPIILVGQQVIAKASDQRAEQGFHDATATLHEAGQIQLHLEAQDAALQAQDAVLADLITHVKGAIASTSGGTTP